MKQPFRRMGGCWSMILAAALAACNSADDGVIGCAEGAEGCACLPPATCQLGLMCQAGVCLAGSALGSGGSFASGGGGSGGVLGTGGLLLSTGGAFDASTGGDEGLGGDLGWGGEMASGGDAGSGGTSSGGASSGGASSGGASSGGASSGGASSGGASSGGGSGSCQPVSCGAGSLTDLDGCYDLPQYAGWQMSNCLGCTIELDGLDISDLCDGGSIGNQPSGASADLVVTDCDNSWVSFTCW